MTTKEKLRNTILKKIERLSDDKLPNLDAYLNDLQPRFSTETPTLSFSGIFEGLELKELTTDLHRFRKDSNDRIPQF